MTVSANTVGARSGIEWIHCAGITPGAIGDRGYGLVELTRPQGGKAVVKRGQFEHPYVVLGCESEHVGKLVIFEVVGSEIIKGQTYFFVRVVQPG